MLASGKSFVFTLDTTGQAQKILTVKGKIIAQQIFIQNDYTTADQSTRLNLRRVSKVISKHKKYLKVRQEIHLVKWENISSDTK